jgi:ferredoxin-NADP reductase
MHTGATIRDMPLLPFIKKVHEHDDVYTFFFEKPTKMKHKAGQHGLFSLVGPYRPHPFSLSSAPDEAFVSFTTRIRQGSRFKQQLLQLKAGDSIHFLGPIMNFTFKEGAKKYVLLAQGVGITPFRSMLVQAHSQKLPVKITVIYVNNQAHTFQSLIESYADTAFFPANSNEFRSLVEQQNPSNLFYISGSPAFIRSTKKLLRNIGVTASHIKADSFLGY